MKLEELGEEKVGVVIVFRVVVVRVGVLIEGVGVLLWKGVREGIEGVKGYKGLEVGGGEMYMGEGC
ncbi:hypothetical protein [Neisseria sicca]|uniref:hypothetical protein n=1 Tax=Neisseria sicca TaxID=490 RepID=UPI0011BD0648|nr:hypothetical protein [Neisseria sicca]